MGIIVFDTIYYPMEITNSYVNIDPILTIKRKKSNEKIVYDVTTHYCCYENADSTTRKPFHKVEITLTDIVDLNDMYGRLYELVKSDFINTKDFQRDEYWKI